MEKYAEPIWNNGINPITMIRVYSENYEIAQLRVNNKRKKETIISKQS